MSSNNGNKRFLKKLIARKREQLARHVEQLGAAFARETGLDPRDTVLVTRQTEDGAIEQWFQSRSHDGALEGLLAACQTAAENGHVEIAEALKGLQTQMDPVRDVGATGVQEHDGAPEAAGATGA